jgi:hypothetical protein
MRRVLSSLVTAPVHDAPHHIANSTHLALRLARSIVTERAGVCDDGV